MEASKLDVAVISMCTKQSVQLKKKETAQAQRCANERRQLKESMADKINNYLPGLQHQPTVSVLL